MPENPANTDAMAPAKKAIDVSKSFRKNSNIPTITTNTLKTLYSAYRKAIAPS